MSICTLQFDIATVFSATVPNGIRIVNITTTEEATINSVTGSGTEYAEYDVTWLVEPAEGELIDWDYDGLGDYRGTDDAPMVAQILGLTNCANPPVSAPNLTGTFNIPDGDAGDAMVAIDLNTLNTGGESNNWTWNGTPPPWANLDGNTGIITGTYAAGTWSNYSVTATNSEGNSTSNTDSVTGAAGTFAPPDGVIGVAYSYTEVEGLAPPYSLNTYNANGQFLPNGLTLNSATGEISGTPNMQGYFPWIRIIGSDGITTYADIDIAQPVGASSAVDDAYDAVEGQALNVAASGLLANDTVN